MMVIMLALGWGAVCICWLELRIPWFVSGLLGLMLTDSDLLAPTAAWHQSRLGWCLIRPQTGWLAGLQNSIGD